MIQLSNGNDWSMLKHKTTYLIVWKPKISWVCFLEENYVLRLAQWRVVRQIKGVAQYSPSFSSRERC